MRKWLLLISILLFSTGSVWAKSPPGNRPDLAPSKLSRIIFFSSSLEEKTINHTETVKKCQEKWEEIPYSKKKGLPFFRYNPKERAFEEFDKQKDILKDLLASTPTDVNDTKTEAISKTAPEVTKSNAEAREVQFSIKNLENIIRQGRIQLRADPTNLEVATKYYDAHVICLSTIIEMHEDFIKNIDTKYGPSIDKIIKKLESVLSKTKERLLKEFMGDQSEQKLTQLQENQKLVLQALQNVRNTRPPKLENWAKGNLPLLSERLEVAKLANETLHITKEAKDLIKNFGSDYEKLSFAPPPLIIFEVETSDFEI
ncbi:MAG: hypothetical protein WBC22_03195 [Sedimentisphaerales bacterium]